MTKLEGGNYFLSDNHDRYENNILNQADNKGACRGFRFFPEGDFDDIFEVSIHVLNRTFSNWGEQIQMSPKLMKIVTETPESILLRGIGNDPMGFSFSDYAVQLNYKNDEINDVTLILIDRNVKIHYHKSAGEDFTTNDRIPIAKSLLTLLIENHEDGDSLTSESSLKDYLQNTYNLEITIDEISMVAELINSRFDNPIINERWIPIGGLLSTSHQTGYYTEMRKSFLEDLLLAFP
jgi:hypothetical protein